MVLDLTIVLTVIGIAIGGVIGFVISVFFYRKSKQDTQSAMQTIVGMMGKILEVLPPPPTSATKAGAWIGRKLTIESRLGMKVEAEVIAEDVTVRVQTKTGEVTAKHQLHVEMKYGVINMDSPLLVMDSEKVVGIMWASGISPNRYSMGVVQLIGSS